MIVPIHDEGKDRLCSALQDGEYHLCDDDDQIKPSAFSFIFQACLKHDDARALDREEWVNNMRLSMVVDRFIVRSWRHDGTERVSYWMKHKTKLLATKSSRFDETTFPVDGFGLTEIPNFEPCVTSLDFEQAVSATCISSKVPSLFLVHTVISYTPRGSAEHQMKVALVSALHQKSVLGMREQFVFGIFQFDTDFLQVVAGIWQDDEMKMYKVGTYSLRDPLSATQFFLILRGIERLSKAYESQLIASGPALVKAAQATRNLPVNEWARPREDVNQGVIA